MPKTCIIIGIAGASASGKSLLAKTIFNEIGSKQVTVISEDSYYRDDPHLSFEERQQINYDHPSAFEHSLLINHLTSLKNDQEVDIPIYSHTLYAREDSTRKVGPHRIIVLEGVLLFVEPELRNMMDVRIFIDTPLDICLIRRLKRDVIERERSFDSVLAQYEKTVRPMYLQFVEPSKRYADIIVPRGGENRIAIDMIKAKMREMLTNH